MADSSNGIYASIDNGHWRVVDAFGRRYLPNLIPSEHYRAIGGQFESKAGCTEERWEVATRMTEREAFLLAGVLRAEALRNADIERRDVAHLAELDRLGMEIVVGNERIARLEAALKPFLIALGINKIRSLMGGDTGG